MYYRWAPKDESQWRYDDREPMLICLLVCHDSGSIKVEGLYLYTLYVWYTGEFTKSFVYIFKLIVF